MQSEQQYLQNYDPSQFEHPSVTVDILIFTVSDRKLRLLLIGIFILCWMILSCALMVWWTGEGSSVIQGIQGRYFLPCLFCLLLGLPRISGKAGKGGKNFRGMVLNASLAVYVICVIVTVILLGMKL